MTQVGGFYDLNSVPLASCPLDAKISSDEATIKSPTPGGEEASSLASIKTIHSSNNVSRTPPQFSSAFGGNSGSGTSSPERKPEPAADTSTSNSISGTKDKGNISFGQGGGFYNFTRFLSSRLLDNASQAATVGSETPDEPASDISPPMPTNQPSESSLPHESTYYVFDPTSSHWASYIYTIKDDAGKKKYQADRVPLELVPLGSDRSAYMIGVSSRDTSTLSKLRLTSHNTYNVEEGLTVEPALWGSTGRVEPNLDSTKVKRTEPKISEARCYEPRIISQDVSQNIMKKARGILEAKRLSRAYLSVIDEEDRHAQSTPSMYPISDEDIQDIIDTVMVEMRQIKPTAMEDQADVHETDEDNVSPTLPKLDNTNNAIRLSSGGPVGPATIISMPQTSFTKMDVSDMQVHTQTKGREASTTATVVSRRSIASISWGHMFHPGRKSSHPSSRKVSKGVSECASTHRPSTEHTGPSSTRTSKEHISLSGFSLNQQTTAEAYADLVADISRAQNTGQTKEEDSDLASFPSLLSRHCTEEWLSPPVEMAQLTRTVSVDLYKQGVDAHSGNICDMPSTCLDEPMKPRHCDRTLFNDASFLCEDDGDVPARRSTEAAVPATVIEKRLGASLGSASHRRRSSHGLNNDTVSPDGILPNLVDKIRKGGHKIFHRHHSPQSSDKAEQGTPHNSFASQSNAASTPRSRDSIVRSLTPRPQGADNAGIYEAMTGSSRLTPTPRKRADTCSEDDRPHLCEEDFDTPVRGASPANA